MNSKYLFQDESIGIYEHCIDLLRNEYAYDKIEYRDIEFVKFTIGHVKNWILLLLLSLIFISGAIWIIFSVYQSSSQGDFLNNLLTFWRGSRSFGLIAILFLLSFGIYSLIASFKKTINLAIKTNSKKNIFDIRMISKEDKVKSLIEFFDERIDKVIVDVRITQPNSSYRK